MTKTVAYSMDAQPECRIDRDTTRTQKFIHMLTITCDLKYLWMSLGGSVGHPAAPMPSPWHVLLARDSQG